MCLVIISANTANAANSDNCRNGINCHASGQAGGDSLGAGASTNTPGQEGQAGNGSTSSGPYSFTRRAYSFACSGNSATINDNICNNATFCPDPLQSRYWVYEATVTGPPETQGPWRSVATQCLDLATADPALAGLRALIEAEFVKKRPATPHVTISPPDGIIVQLDNGFSAGFAAPVQLPPDTILGLPVTITATPTRWTWDFGDNTTLTTNQPGTPQTLQITHAYTTTGTHPVTVTIDYTGTFTLAGYTGTFPITGTAQVTSPPTTITVHEAHAQLVAD